MKQWGESAGWLGRGGRRKTEGEWVVEGEGKSIAGEYLPR